MSDYTDYVTEMYRPQFPFSGGRYTIPAGSTPEEIESIIRSRMEQPRPLHTVSSSSTRDRMRDARMPMPPSPEGGMINAGYEEFLPPPPNPMTEPPPAMVKYDPGMQFNPRMQQTAQYPRDQRMMVDPRRNPRDLAASMEPDSPQLRSDMVQWQGRLVPIDEYRRLVAQFWAERGQ